MTLPRLFVDQTLGADALLALPAAVARHVQVLRLQPGAGLVLFDGRSDLEWPATIMAIGRARVDVRIGAPVRIDRELPTAVTLAIGMPANDRMDALVEKAGELGAAAIQPLLCERSVLRVAGERAAAKRRHWQGVSVAASEQCGRARVAEVQPVRPLPAWLAALSSLADPLPSGPDLRIVLSFADTAVSLPALLAASARKTGLGAASLTVLSGPEGGLTADEEAAAVARGFVAASLGARVLRADTAPLAVLAWLGLDRAACGARASAH